MYGQINTSTLVSVVWPYLVFSYTFPPEKKQLLPLSYTTWVIFTGNNIIRGRGACYCYTIGTTAPKRATIN